MQHRGWTRMGGAAGSVAAWLGLFCMAAGCGHDGGNGGADGRLAQVQQPTVRGDAPAPLQGKVSRFVVLKGQGAIASLPSGLDPASPAARKHIQTRAAALRASHEALRPRLEAAGAHIVTDVVLVANAFQIQVDAKALPGIASLPEVARLEAPSVLAPTLGQAVPLVGAPAVWESGSGLRGQGIRIGILDTGIDYLHADLGGIGDPAAYAADDHTVVEPGSFPTTKVVGGYDFAGDGYDALGLNGSTTPSPDDDPIDCGGHGTHVAGIAAGTGEDIDGKPYAGPWSSSLDPAAFRVSPGVAPEASLYAIKIFGCQGSTDLMLPGLEYAADPNGDSDVGDRLDVVNASLGSDFALGSQTEADAIAALTTAGGLFVAAAGNSSDGYRAHFTSSFPASTATALSVGATYKAAATSTFLALNVSAPGSVAGAYPIGQGAVGPTIAQLGTVSGSVIAADPIDGCAAINNAAAMAGNIGLVRRGNCQFVEKAANLDAAGAIAMIFVDIAYADFPLNPFSSGSSPPNIPMFSLRQFDGEPLIAAAPLTASITNGVTTTVSWGPDYMASFSGRGPTADLGKLKPEVSAPGVSIISAARGSGQGATAMSGTSMATPMVTGAAALLRQGRPTLGPLEIKELLASTGMPVVNAASSLFPAELQGGGRIEVDAALGSDVSARVDGVPGEIGISFGAIEAPSATSVQRTVVVTNRGASAVDLDTAVSVAVPWPGVTPSVSPASVHVAAAGTATATLTLDVDPALLPPAPTYDGFTPPNSVNTHGNPKDQPNHHLTEATGMVSFTPSGGTAPVAQVPYLAVVRAATARTVGAVTGCAPAAGTARLVLDGAALPFGQATSVLELGTTHSTFSDPSGPDASRDIVAVGALRDPAGTRVHFGVVTAGDWVTPARSWQSEVGIEVDTNNDQVAEYLVLAEGFRAIDPQPLGQQNEDAASAVVLRIADGVVVTTTIEPLNASMAAYTSTTYPGGFPAHDTQLYFNNVVVFPVPLADLGFDAHDPGTFAYRGVSAVSRFPLLVNQPLGAPLDTTDWATVETGTAHVALPGSVELSPLVVDDTGSIDITLPEVAPLPQLLVLHHTNGAQPRHEIVDLSSLVLEGSNLSVQATAGDPVALGEPATATVVVANSNETVRTGVQLAVSATGGAITTLSPTTGTCTTSSCELGTLDPGASVTVTVTGMPSAEGTFVVTATVTSALGCELDPANDSATASITVGPGGQGGGGGAIPAGPAAVEGEGGCGCRLADAGHGTAPWSTAAAALFAATALRRRRPRPARRW